MWNWVVGNGCGANGDDYDRGGGGEDGRGRSHLVAEYSIKSSYFVIFFLIHIFNFRI